MNDGTLVNGTNNVMVELMKKLMCGWLLEMDDGMMAKDFQLEVRTYTQSSEPFLSSLPKRIFSNDARLFLTSSESSRFGKI